MTLSPPNCTCWMDGPFPCDIHGIEPREYHTCREGTERGGSRSNCPLCTQEELRQRRIRSRVLFQRITSASRGGYDG